MGINFNIGKKATERGDPQSQDVWHLLKHFTQIDDCQITMTEQLSHTGYMKLRELFQRIKGNWDKKSNSFIFPFPPKSVLKQLALTKTMPKKNEFAFFPTKQIMFDGLATESSLWKYKHGCVGTYVAEDEPLELLEPSAGTGACADFMKTLMPEDHPFNITTIEIDKWNAGVLRDKGYDPIQTDFLKWKTTKKFDLIIMNPPFQGEAFIKHIRHAQSMLKPQGVLYSVMPAGWLLNSQYSSKGKKALRDDMAVINQHILNDLYHEAFDGTNIATVWGELWSPEAVEKEFSDDGNIEYSVEIFSMCVTNVEADNKAMHKAATSGDDKKLTACIKKMIGKFAHEGNPVFERHLEHYKEDMLNHYREG